MVQVKPSTYLIGIIFFAFIVTGGVSLFAIANNVDPSRMDANTYNEYNVTFNKLDYILEQTTQLQAQVESEPTGLGDFGYLNALVSKAWNTLKLLLASFSFMGDAMEGMSNIFQVPVWMIDLLSACIVIVIVFAIFAAVFGINDI